MKLYRVTSPSGETWLFWAISADQAKNQATIRARHLHPDLNPASLGTEQMVVQEDANAIAGMQVGDQFISVPEAAPVGSLTGNNIQQFRDAVMGEGAFTNQGLGDLARFAQFFGQELPAGQTTGGFGGESGALTRQPGDTMIPEIAGDRYGITWDRALKDIGMGGGLSRTIANPYRSALGAFADIGFAGNAPGPIFADLPEGREKQTIYTRALRNMMGGAEGQESGWNLSQAAKNLFNQADATYPGLQPFLDPTYWGQGGGDMGTAIQLAELGLAGLGRGRFGAMSHLLPDAQTLVTDYGTQRIGSGQKDLREYIRSRLGAGAGSGFTSPV